MKTADYQNKNLLIDSPASNLMLPVLTVIRQKPKLKSKNQAGNPWLPFPVPRFRVHVALQERENWEYETTKLPLETWLPVSVGKKKTTNQEAEVRNGEPRSV